MINECRDLALQFSAPNFPVLDVSGKLFLDILGVDWTQLTNNIIVLVCLYFAMVAFALAAGAARGVLRRCFGWGGPTYGHASATTQDARPPINSAGTYV